LSGSWANKVKRCTASEKRVFVGWAINTMYQSVLTAATFRTVPIKITERVEI
jgi:hypothetical protein